MSLTFVLFLTISGLVAGKPTCPQCRDASKLVCEEGWTKFGDLKCIKFANEHLDYDQGERYCREEYSGAHMVTIHSEEEQSYIYEYISKDLRLGYPVWIGGKQIDFENILWLDRTQSEFTNWAPQEPSSPSEICLAMLPASGKWADIQCNATAIPMCERAPIKKWPFYIPFCREGWFQYKDQKCIRLVSTAALNFYESQEYCRAKYNAKLTTIQGLELQEFLTNVVQFKDIKLPVWLGAIQNDFSAFHWIDRTEVNFTNFEENEPNDPDEICLSMYSDTGRWSDSRCNERKVVLCQRILSPGSDDFVLNATACEGGWLQYSNKCFRVVNMRLNFDEAELLCSSIYNAHLASIHSLEEQKLLLSFFESVNVKNGTEMWIGGQQVDFNYFNWMDGSSLNYTNWDINEPNAPADKCIEMQYTNGKWNDIDCSKQRFVICEKPIIDLSPKRPPLYLEPGSEDEDYEDEQALKGNQTIPLAVAETTTGAVIADVADVADVQAVDKIVVQEAQLNAAAPIVPIIDKVDKVIVPVVEVAAAPQVVVAEPVVAVPVVDKSS